MADFVVDASIVVQHLIDDQLTAYVDQLFARVGAELSLYIPEICLVECTNVLWKEVRFHDLPVARAISLLDNLTELPITIMPASEVLKRALQIGLEHSLAVYDSVYIALAESRNYPLITADVRQGAAAQRVGVVVKPIEEFI